MAKRKICQAMAVVLALGMCTTGLTGCGNEKRADGKTEILSLIHISEPTRH